MPTPVRRLVPAIGALTATLLLGGAGAGCAGADPDDSGTTSDPGQTTDPLPPPRPRPTMKIVQEEPVIDSSGGAGAGEGFGQGPMSETVSDLPVLQAPAALPGRVGTPRPLAEVVPVGAAPRVLGEGAAGVGAPAGRGSVTHGSVQAGEFAPSRTSMSNVAYRQGFPQYLRSARVGELATVALPGVAGLLAITAGGGVIGYRQADSGRRLRADAERFLQ